MKILVNNKQKLLSEDALSKWESRIASALSKFGENIESTELTIRDVNGPKGGCDKECQIIVNMRKMGGVLLTMKDSSLSKVLSSSIQRVERMVARRIERKYSQNRGKPYRMAHPQFR